MTTDKKLLLATAQKNSINIKTIYDCGSRDALDAVELKVIFDAEQVHVFECNPPSVEKCRENLSRSFGEKNKGYSWFLNPLAVGNKSGNISFFPIDTDATITPHEDGNPGASSLFKANPDYPNETYVQKETTVSMITLKDYIDSGHPYPDLLWVDVQGAEILLLEGLDNYLNEISIIHVEVSFRPMYLGQPLYWEIDSYLSKRGFIKASLDIGRWPKMTKLYKLMKTGPWVGNAIYIKAK
jgi:FkbM family methyltransferase